MDIPEQSFLLLFFIVLSAFFSGVETAFVSLSDIRLNHLCEKENKKSILRVKQLKENSERLIITILIGNNLVNIAASSFATKVAIDIFESRGIGIAIGLMTLIILIFGEIIPKNVAMAKNELIAVSAAPIIRTLQIILYPAIYFLEKITILMARPMNNEDCEPLITEAEIKSVVNLGEEVGEIEKDERIMIHNIFRFSELQANEIMTDRTQIFSLDTSSYLKDVSDTIVSKGFSRIPIYEDQTDNIKGILYAKDILQHLLTKSEDRPLRDLIRPAMIIPETMLIDNLLREFKREKVHIAMVVDEHGGISGLITIEDILEEIVGDIYDETDKDEELIRIIDNQKCYVKGETEIEEVNRVLELNLSEEEDYETISGYILSQLRHIPEVGEELAVGDIVIRVTQADQQRIIEVEIEKKRALAGEDALVET
ncbi:MAG: hemolysin [Candidatus Magnetoglobus multicellularis str. Araruama]|uniref:Hemolysin n=1 Tax=Candidatus Magnetoglobus multicellularis str. Araruama TaxID=890399 RepID=A0A1V1PBE6_9BACT|nr:MAG: hemolysin [Candidatus Magnetoglobus multicellularis str. Araruama]